MTAYNFTRSRWVLFMALLLAACSSQQPRVHEGLFQKRQHRAGWHVDLGKRHTAASKRQNVDPSEEDGTVKRTRSTFKPENAQLHQAQVGSEGLQESPLKRTNSLGEEPMAMTGQGRPEPWMLSPGHAFTERAEPSLLTQEEKVPKVWNKWALPAFVLALATVAYGILGTNALVLVIAVVATLVIAAIALRKGRRYEWAGKGFALGAMILGTFAALITLIALLNGRV